MHDSNGHHRRPVAIAFAAGAFGLAAAALTQQALADHDSTTTAASAADTAEPTGSTETRPATPPKKPSMDAKSAGYGHGMAQAMSAGHVLLRPTDLTWTVAKPPMPPGTQVAVLEGDPSQPGAFTMRFKVGPGFRVPPHWHPADEHVTVISGSFAMGMGDVMDEAAAQRMPAGSFMLMPATEHHYAFTEEDTVIQIHGIGPWGITYVNPADDPRNVVR